MSHTYQRVISSELETRLQAYGFISPRYHGHSLGSVLPAAAAALGQPEVLDKVAATTGGSDRARSAAAAFGMGEVERVCVVLIDGLGLHNLRDNAASAPFLSSLLGDNTSGRTGFPSTTATAMGLFGTGSSPGQTAMVGYSAQDPVSGVVGNFVSWKDLGEPTEIQRHPVIFELLANAGVQVTSVGLERFADSGMTQAALRGATYLRASTLGEHVNAAAAALSRPGLVHLYWGEVDKIGHHHGPTSSQWRRALAHTDYEMSRLYQALPPKTALIVTADHGMITTDPKSLIDISSNYALSKGVRTVAGEPRASHIYLNSPGSAVATAKRWNEVLGDRALVLAKEEAIGQGLFGTATKYAKSWIGDLVVAMTGTGTIADTTTAPPASLKLLGVHGSLTPAEVEIPILVVQT